MSDGRESIASSVGQNITTGATVGLLNNGSTPSDCYKHKIKPFFSQKNTNLSNSHNIYKQLCNLLELRYKTLLGFYTTPKDTEDNRHNGHVGVPNKRNDQNPFAKRTPC